MPTVATYKPFTFATYGDWRNFRRAVSRFVTQLGPERVISITGNPTQQSKTRFIDGHLYADDADWHCHGEYVVWYWAE